jgi:low affinity Fe/Cu permease
VAEPGEQEQGGIFDRFAEAGSRVVSGGVFFAVALLLVILWLPTLLIFDSGTWQLVLSTATSVMAFLLVVLLQNSERRKDEAANRKLDELSAAVASLLEQRAEEDGSAADQSERLRERIAEERF